MCNEKRYIPFVKRHKAKSELLFIEDALKQDFLEHGSKYTRLCEEWLERYYQCDRAIVTASGFSALYIIMLLENIGEGDEVILSSYSCPSALNSVLLAKGTPVLCGIDDTGCLDAVALKKTINPNTKMVILNHYGGFACELQTILRICREYNIIVVEDCATAIGSMYHEQLLGTFGDYAIISFNDKKDVTSGEGGALIINKTDLNNKAYTYRNGIARKHVGKENRGIPIWCGVGFSNKLSDMVSALLYAQLLEASSIIKKKQCLWEKYRVILEDTVPEYGCQICSNKQHSITNGNTFYLKFQDNETRNLVKNKLLAEGIETLAHYGTLRTCMFTDQRIKYYGEDDGSVFDSLILRLPIYTELEINDIEYICSKIVKVLEMIKNGKYFIDSKM